MISRKNRTSRNAIKSIPTMLESLEPRRLFAGNFALSGGVLNVHGTNGNDQISVVESSKGTTITVAGQTSTYQGSTVFTVEVHGFDGNDQITVDTNRYAVVYGGAGNDVITVVRGSLTATKANEINGGLGDDVIYGSFRNDLINGEAGNDSIRAYGGMDAIYGGDGSDWIYGGDGPDNIFGNAGVDYVYGEAGNDNIFVSGDHTRDFVDGGLGWDTCYHDVHWLSYFNDSLVSVETKFGS